MPTIISVQNGPFLHSYLCISGGFYFISESERWELIRFSKNAKDEEKCYGF